MAVVLDIANNSKSKVVQTSYAEPIVVIGAGPVGTRVTQELVKSGHDVVLFNAERWKPYNRVQLTPLLASEAQLANIYLDDRFEGPGNIRRYDGVSVADINREEKYVSASNGRMQRYSKLVLAMGSRAYTPPIPGSELSDVYTFRNFDDTEALIARSFSARDVVIIGGGLLGLEAARGMKQRGAKVTVIEHENRLMPRQLDTKAGAYLKEAVEALDVKVITGVPVKEIVGSDRPENVLLGDGQNIKADTVIFCTGVRANTQLPSAIGLKFNRGVLVNEQMQTSDPDIYAVGECAQFEDIVYGLVGPGLEQATVAVKAINGQTLEYKGSTPCTKLKVLGINVFSMGDIENAELNPNAKTHIFEDAEQGQFRRIITENGKLIAALGVGSWPEASRLQLAVSETQKLSTWTLRSFVKTGQLWKAQSDDVTLLPDTHIICNCTGVTKGQILASVAAGAGTIEDLRASTSANTVCGSCQVDVASLLGGKSKFEAVRFWKILTGSSLAAMALAAIITLMPPIAVSKTFIVDELFRNLWFETAFKQYSGYTTLALTVVAALLGMRKRIGFMSKLGSYDSWRLVHLIVGSLTALTLIWHTGFRMGSNLNFWLMSCFMLTLIFGAISGLITGGEHELRDRALVKGRASPRAIPVWIHIIIMWPLPILLIFHILSVYSY